MMTPGKKNQSGAFSNAKDSGGYSIDKRPEARLSDRELLEGAHRMLREMVGEGQTVINNEVTISDTERAVEVLRKAGWKTEVRGAVTYPGGKTEMVGEEACIPSPGTIVFTLDGEAWCPHEVERHIDFSEDPAGVVREPGFTVVGRVGIFGAKDRGKFWKLCDEPDPLVAVREHVDKLQLLDPDDADKLPTVMAPPVGERVSLWDWLCKLRELVGAKP